MKRYACINSFDDYDIKIGDTLQPSIVAFGIAQVFYDKKECILRAVECHQHNIENNKFVAAFIKPISKESSSYYNRKIYLVEIDRDNKIIEILDIDLNKLLALS